MQCVILAGGSGVRIRPWADSCPKTLLPVRGRPFAYHQLHWLAAQGVSEVVYCIGQRGDLIRRYWAMEPSPVRSMRWVDEREPWRGDGGVLRLAFEQGVLEKSFLVIRGDSFLPVRFAPVWQAHESSGLSALMTAFKNESRWENYSDYGLLGFRREMFAEVPQICDLAALLHGLSLEGQLARHEVNERLYDVGSVAGLQDLERYLADREPALK